MNFIQQALKSAGVAIATGAIGLAGSYIALYLKRMTDKIQKEIESTQNKEQQELVTITIENLNKLIYNAVYAAQKTLAEQLKTASEDGKLTLDDAEQLRTVVKTAVMNQLTNESKKILSKQVGNLDIYIPNEIEIQLDKVKEDLKKLQ